jgi:hypothetical protein
VLKDAADVAGREPPRRDMAGRVFGNHKPAIAGDRDRAEIELQKKPAQSRFQRRY